MASTGLSSLDNLLGSDGYPDRSTVLIVGPPGIGKEALGYWFAHSGLVQNDFTLYVTKLSSKEVTEVTGVNPLMQLGRSASDISRFKSND